jgi:membrane carboxypeptidase/penicillin-binding protein
MEKQQDDFMEKPVEAPELEHEEIYKQALAVHEKLLKGVSKEYAMVFVKPTDEFIRRRMKESKAFCEDLLQPEKSYTTCGKIVKDKARKQAQNGMACIEDMTVFEWIEDYIHRDEAKAAEEEKKKAEKPKTTAPKIKPAEKFDAKKAAEKAVAKSEEKKDEDNLSEVKDNLSEVKDDVQENKVTPISAGRKAVQKPKPEPKPEEPKKKKGEVEGQMSLFDFFG